MKSLITVFSFVITAATFSYGSQKNVANYYYSLPHQYLSGKIKLEVSHVSPINSAMTEDYITFTAHTYDDGVSGGSIRLIVHNDEVKSITSKVGFTPDLRPNGHIKTRRISGTFVKLGQTYSVVIGGALEELANENPDVFEFKGDAEHTFNVANVGKPDADETREDLISLFNQLNTERRAASTGGLTRDEFVTRLKSGETFRVLTKNGNMKFLQQEEEEEEESRLTAYDVFRDFNQTAAEIDIATIAEDDLEDEDLEDEDDKQNEEGVYVVELIYDNQ